MNPAPEIGKILLLFGVVIAAVGLLLVLAPKIPLLGRLPGDIVIRKGNFTVYFPIVTSIVLSVVISIILSQFRK